MMKGKTSALYSAYFIDGHRRQFTPAELLNGCLAEGASAPSQEKNADTILDET